MGITTNILSHSNKWFSKYRRSVVTNQSWGNSLVKITSYGAIVRRSIVLYLKVLEQFLEKCYTKLNCFGAMEEVLYQSGIWVCVFVFETFLFDRS